MSADNLLAVVFAGFALVVIARELRRGPEVLTRTTRTIRWLPFTAIALLSIFMAGRAPHGRHPAAFDFGLTWPDVSRALTKVPHWRSIAVLFLLAVVAVTVWRLWAAFFLTMAVGVGWELAECTVVRHYAKLADLVPDALSAVATLLVVWLLGRLVKGRPDNRA